MIGASTCKTRRTTGGSRTEPTRSPRSARRRPGIAAISPGRLRQCRRAGAVPVGSAVERRRSLAGRRSRTGSETALTPANLAARHSAPPHRPARQQASSRPWTGLTAAFGGWGEAYGGPWWRCAESGGVRLPARSPVECSGVARSQGGQWRRTEPGGQWRRTEPGEQWRRTEPGGAVASHGAGGAVASRGARGGSCRRGVWCSAVAWRGARGGSCRRGVWCSAVAWRGVRGSAVAGAV